MPVAFISCVRCVPCSTATNYSPDAHLLELVQELVDAHREKKQRKSAVAMSDVRDDVWLELQAALGLEVKTVGCNLSVTGSVTAFKWDERDEDKRSDYSDWWQALLDPKKVRVAVMNGNAGNYSLTIPLLEGIPFRLSGTTDVAVVDSHSAITTTPVVGTLFVIEIKKPAVVRSLTQRVVASLIRDFTSSRRRRSTGRGSCKQSYSLQTTIRSTPQSVCSRIWQASGTFFGSRRTPTRRSCAPRS